MKQTVNSYTFEQAFRAFNRYDQFGYDGLQVLFDYLEEMEQSTGEEMELDVIALCCDYSHDTVQEIADSYDVDLSECANDDEKREVVRDYLESNTVVCGETDTGFVYCSAF